MFYHSDIWLHSRAGFAHLSRVASLRGPQGRHLQSRAWLLCTQECTQCVHSPVCPFSSVSLSKLMQPMWGQDLPSLLKAVESGSSWPSAQLLSASPITSQESAWNALLFLSKDYLFQPSSDFCGPVLYLKLQNLTCLSRNVLKGQEGNYILAFPLSFQV